MRARLEKTEGVEAVDVSLKDGRVHVRLAAGNTVPLQDVQDIVKSVGLTPGEAEVRGYAEVVIVEGRPRLKMVGVAETFAVEPERAAEVGALAGRRVEVSGVAPALVRSVAPVLRLTAIRAADEPR